VVEAVGAGVIVKVILENHYLTDIEDLRLMRVSVGAQVQVKAAHGVRTLEAALQVIEAGATRFGATRTKKILDDFKRYREEKEG
jgi:deoxyribose-phosphate aldolase